jgi:4-hydroxy-tetrahydrodipicolinate synthase
VDFLCAAGAQGIALLGSTGEFLHLTVDDRVRLTYLAAKRSRVPIIAGISHSTLDGAVEMGRQACSAGAACLLLMPPYFFRYSQEDIKEFYQRFSSEVGSGVPIYLYNIPVFSNEISAETACELLCSGRFAGIKDSSGQADYLQQLLPVRTRFPVTLLVGDDNLFVASRQSGVDGVVSGVACAVPELMLALDRAIQASDAARIERLQARLQEFLQWVRQFPAPVAIKLATAARGLKVGPLAVPLSPAGVRRSAEFQEWFRGWLPDVRKEAAHV